MIFKDLTATSPYQVTDAPNLYDSPDVDITAYDLARTDGAAKVYDRYKPRSFCAQW